MLLHPPQPSSLAAHYDLHPHHAPFHLRSTPRALTVDRLPLPHDENHLDDSPLEHHHSYSYVPRGHPVHNSPSPDAMYQHSVHSHLYDDQHNTQPNQPQEYNLQARQQPPSIHTDNLLYPSDSANYSPSPMSSPADNSIASQSSARQFSFPQPMSAPHSHNAFPPRFDHEHEHGLSRLQFSNPTLDRRMSEPVLGAGRQTFAQPPPSHHDTFAYTATSSNTVVQPSPLSPRPSSSYSSYGTYQEHQRDSSGASIGSAGLSDLYAQPVATPWSSSLKHAELETEPHVTSSPLSPLYAGSVASGSDASVTGLPSPPSQSRPSPSEQPATLPGARPPQPPQASASATPTPRPGGNNSKTYSFVSLPGNAVKKRPRRRYDEIERLYQCRCVSSYVCFHVHTTVGSFFALGRLCVCFHRSTLP